MAQEVGSLARVKTHSAIFCTLFIVILSSCKSNPSCLETFCVDEVFSTYNALSENDFQKSEVDALMFEKRINDTLVVYEYNQDGSCYDSKYWIFTVRKDAGLLEVKSFLERKNCSLLIPGSFDELTENKLFCVRNFQTNRIFSLN